MNAWICLFGVIDLNFKCWIRRGQRMDDIQVESPAVPRHHRKPLRNWAAATGVRVCHNLPSYIRKSAAVVFGYPSNRRKAWQTKCEGVAVLGRGSNTTLLLSTILFIIVITFKLSQSIVTGLVSHGRLAVRNYLVQLLQQLLVLQTTLQQLQY